MANKKDDRLIPYGATRCVAAVIFLLASILLQAAPRVELKLKSTVVSAKTSLCLADIITEHNLSTREAEKLAHYCRIELKAERTILNAKDVELHAWAAGIIPEKISGGPVVIHRTAAILDNVKLSTAPTNKLRRGSKVTLVLRSEHMAIARNAVLLADGFPGESVELRPDGTRKVVRAKLNSDGTAELE